MQHRSTLAGSGATGQHYELPATPAARKGVEPLQARRNADALTRLSCLLPSFQIVEGGPHHIRQRRNIIRAHDPVGYRGYFRRGPIHNPVRIGDGTRRKFVTEKT